jgi:hypothetical protein
MTNQDFHTQRADENPKSTVARLRQIIKEYGLGAETGITTILCDLRHLCDVYGVDFDACVITSWSDYNDELPEEDEG